MLALIASRRILFGLLGFLQHITENILCHVIDAVISILNGIMPHSTIAVGKPGHKGIWPPFIAPLETDSRLIDSHLVRNLS
jgi:hypothetical protein